MAHWGRDRHSLAPNSEVTRAVIVPLPANGWRTKEKVSTTGSPPGPTGTRGTLGVLQDGGEPGRPTQTPVCGAPTHANATIRKAATPSVITQARTLRNFVSSARIELTEAVPAERLLGTVGRRHSCSSRAAGARNSTWSRVISM